MNDFHQLLEGRLSGRVAWLGLGNENLGDDAAGMILAARLAASVPAPHAVLLAGTAPERHLRELREERFDTVVFLDAVEFGGPPGAVAWFDPPEFASRFPPISTHKIPLSILARLILEGGRTRVGFLGLQPGSLRHGPGLSPEVARAVDALESLVLDHLDRLTPARRWDRELSCR
jgi:hydrogenase maturation protease